MRKVLAVIIILVTTVLICQSPSAHYQSALILQVKEHQGTVGGRSNDPTITSYDVTLRVKDTGTEYEVLYTPRPGVHGFQYMAGTDMLVLVESKTITFNDMLGRSTKVPIVSQKPARAPKN